MKREKIHFILSCILRIFMPLDEKFNIEKLWWLYMKTFMYIHRERAREGKSHLIQEEQKKF